MAQFSVAAAVDVVPQKKSRGPSQRVQTQQAYQEALHNAVIDQGEALVVILDDEDKPLTIRNRIKRAADRLELKDIAIRCRKD